VRFGRRPLLYGVPLRQADRLLREPNLEAAGRLLAESFDAAGGVHLGGTSRTRRLIPLSMALLNERETSSEFECLTANVAAIDNRYNKWLESQPEPQPVCAT